MPIPVLVQYLNDASPPFLRIALKALLRRGVAQILTRTMGQVFSLHIVV